LLDRRVNGFIHRICWVCVLAAKKKVGSIIITCNLNQNPEMP